MGIVIGLSTSVFSSYDYSSLDAGQHNKLRKVLLSNGLLIDGHTEDSSRGGGGDTAIYRLHRYLQL